MIGSRRTVFEEYRPRKILNKNKRADHWFWSRYSAYPYIGCQHGCAFCYIRETKYSPFDDIEDFAYRIKVKENAVDLLRKELSRSSVDVVFTGDYQPLERKFQISRKMLQVCADLGFPVMVLERSPLVLRDLDVIKTIHEKSAAVVAFSVIYNELTSSSNILRKLEGLAPPPSRRFEAMGKFSSAGILTGTCMMPILPGLCDDKYNLEEIIRKTAGSGGRFILIGGLTLGDQQREFFLNKLKDNSPALLPFYEKAYPPGMYALQSKNWNKVAQMAAELCAKHGISDRMPRPVVPGEKREFNKRLAEKLANEAYRLDINASPQNDVWSFRKAAWAIEDLEQDVRMIFRTMSLRGLSTIPGLAGNALTTVEKVVQEMTLFPQKGMEIGISGPKY